MAAGKTAAFAPGRVELLGNHTDYNQGVVLGAFIVYSTWAAFQGSGPRTRKKVAGLNVPAPTSPLYGWSNTHPYEDQNASRRRRIS